MVGVNQPRETLLVRFTLIPPYIEQALRATKSQEVPAVRRLSRQIDPHLRLLHLLHLLRPLPLPHLLRLQPQVPSEE